MQSILIPDQVTSLSKAQKAVLSKCRNGLKIQENAKIQEETLNATDNPTLKLYRASTSQEYHRQWYSQ